MLQLSLQQPFLEVARGSILEGFSELRRSLPLHLGLQFLLVLRKVTEVIAVPASPHFPVIKWDRGQERGTVNSTGRTCTVIHRALDPNIPESCWSSRAT